MRREIVVLAIVALLLLVAGLVPAVAQVNVVTDGGRLGWSLPIYIESNSAAPAGRISIYFSDRKYGEPLFYYIGQSREILVASDIPAFRWCVAKVTLTGPYADQVVGSTWRNLGDRADNTFVSQVGEGEQEAQFFIQGRKKTYLRILFFPIKIGDRGFTTEQSFRVYSQGGDGLTDYKCQLEVAKRSWPSAPPELHELWARIYVYESWYKSQGMVIAGTEKYPRNTTAALRDYMEIMQREVDAATAQKRAEAERSKSSPAEAALAQPPATTATVTATAKAEPVKVTVTAEPKQRVTWTLVISKPVVRVETTNATGKEQVTEAGSGRAWVGSILFPASEPGRILVRLTFTDGTVGSWREVDVKAGLSANYADLQEVQ